MLEQNKELFSSFKFAHDLFVQNPDANQNLFNEVGEKILPIVREHEARLCGKTERGVYSKFSSNLAEKFRGEVKVHFPRIDFVGVKIS